MEPGLQWRSMEWPDGSMYEGLTKEGTCHSHGVMHYANGDRYEGEFMRGRQNGYGVYVWSDGMIFRGEWMEGTTHGCGVQLWKEGDKKFAVKEGKFLAGEYIGPVLTCSTDASNSVAVEADYAAALARSLQTDKGQQRRQARSRGQLPPSTAPSPSLPWPFSLFSPKAAPPSKPSAALPTSSTTLPTPSTTPHRASASTPSATAPGTPLPGAGLRGSTPGASSAYSKLTPKDQQALARAVEQVVAREINALPRPPGGATATITDGSRGG